MRVSSLTLTHIWQLESSQDSTASTFCNEALVDTSVRLRTLDSLSTCAPLCFWVCSSVSELLTLTWIVSARFLMAFCLAESRRSASEPSLLLETPVAKKYFGVMDSGFSTQDGLGPSPQDANTFKELVNIRRNAAHILNTFALRNIQATPSARNHALKITGSALFAK